MAKFDVLFFDSRCIERVRFRFFSAVTDRETIKKAIVCFVSTTATLALINLHSIHPRAGMHPVSVRVCLSVTFCQLHDQSINHLCTALRAAVTSTDVLARPATTIRHILATTTSISIIPRRSECDSQPSDGCGQTDDDLTRTFDNNVTRPMTLHRRQMSQMERASCTIHQRQ